MLRKQFTQFSIIPARCSGQWDEMGLLGKGTKRKKIAWQNNPEAWHNRQHPPIRQHHSPHHTPPPLLTHPDEEKMNSLRTVSRVALRAKPTRSLFAATRTYADAAGPGDKIRLSLTLPHQVRGHSIVELEGRWRGGGGCEIPGRAIADVDGVVDYLQSFGCVRFATPRILFPRGGVYIYKQ